MPPAKQKAFQAAADKAIAWSAAEHLKREAELADSFRKRGLEIYTPDVKAFRELRAEGLPRLRRGEETGRRACSRRSTLCRYRSAVSLTESRGLAAPPGGETSPRRLLAVMFVAFILQIAFRYFFNFPIGWTSELSVITWLWLVLWGAAFVVKESEEIRFDLVYSAAGRRTPSRHGNHHRALDRDPVCLSRSRQRSNTSVS
mgnify:CR=1 FL=1